MEGGWLSSAHVARLVLIPWTVLFPTQALNRSYWFLGIVGLLIVTALGGSIAQTVANREHIRVYC